MQTDETIKALPVLDQRIPSWERNELGLRACPLCRSRGQDRYRRPDGLPIALCELCGTFYVSLAPSAASLARFYATYFAEHSLHITPDGALLTRLKVVDPWADPRMRVVASLSDLEGKRVLDVGCGRGWDLLRYQQLGAAVTGVDLDPDAVAFARAALGLEHVHHGTLDLIPPQERFDIILMNDFVEHPLDPMDALLRCAAMLTPGGLLTIWTPNASQAWREEEPVLFRVDLEHMQYLSFRSCQYLATELDLDLVHLEGVGFAQLAGMERGRPRTGRMPAAVGRLAQQVKLGLEMLGVVRALQRTRAALLEAASRRGSYQLLCILQRRWRECIAS